MNSSPMLRSPLKVFVLSVVMLAAPSFGYADNAFAPPAGNAFAPTSGNAFAPPARSAYPTYQANATTAQPDQRHKKQVNQPQQQPSQNGAVWAVAPQPLPVAPHGQPPGNNPQRVVPSPAFGIVNGVRVYANGYGAPQNNGYTQAKSSYQVQQPVTAAVKNGTVQYSNGYSQPIDSGYRQPSNAYSQQQPVTESAAGGVRQYSNGYSQSLNNGYTQPTASYVTASPVTVTVANGVRSYSNGYSQPSDNGYTSPSTQYAPTAPVTSTTENGIVRYSNGYSASENKGYTAATNSYAAAAPVTSSVNNRVVTYSNGYSQPISNGYTGSPNGYAAVSPVTATIENGTIRYSNGYSQTQPVGNSGQAGTLVNNSNANPATGLNSYRNAPSSPTGASNSPGSVSPAVGNRGSTVGPSSASSGGGGGALNFLGIKTAQASTIGATQPVQTNGGPFSVRGVLLPTMSPTTPPQLTASPADPRVAGTTPSVYPGLAGGTAPTSGSKYFTTAEFSITPSASKSRQVGPDGINGQLRIQSGDTVTFLASHKNGTTDGSPTDGHWQCSELITRYGQALGLPTATVGNGKDAARNFAGESNGLFQFKSAGSPLAMEPPHPGAVISISGWGAYPDGKGADSAGHVGIVQQVIPDSRNPNHVTVKLFDQNFPSADWKTVDMVKSKDGSWSGTMSNQPSGEPYAKQVPVVGWADPVP